MAMLVERLTPDPATRVRDRARAEIFFRLQFGAQRGTSRVEPHHTTLSTWLQIRSKVYKALPYTNPNETRMSVK